MILLVDAGNTRIKWVMRAATREVARGDLVHAGMAPGKLGAHLWGRLERPGRVVIASVAGPVISGALAGWCAEAWGLEADLISTQASGFGVTNAYAEPWRLGVDRWVALIGARAGYTGACCIVDCGTAITLDALAADGRHLGGQILPGVRLMRAALYRDTRQIPPEACGEVELFGRSTRDCVCAGTTYTVTAAVDAIARQMAAAMDGPVTRILTGGDAADILPRLSEPFVLDADLIFDGLACMARTSVPGGEEAASLPAG